LLNGTGIAPGNARSKVVFWGAQNFSKETHMNDLVKFLTTGDHPVTVSLRPEKTLELFRDAVNRGYVHIKFTDTRGGTELGVQIDPSRSDLAAMKNRAASGSVVFVGDLSLDYTPVTCSATIDIDTLEGTGRLVARPN
jgi:hypothetical protein